MVVSYKEQQKNKNLNDYIERKGKGTFGLKDEDNKDFD